MIELRSVAFGPTGNRLFENLNWKLDDPGRYLLLGANGTGKTLICSLISGSGRPASGSVEVDGEPVGSGRSVSCFHARAQDDPPEGETIWDYLRVELQNSGCSAGELQAAWDQIAELYPAGKYAPLHAISHGQYLLLHVLLASLIPVRVVLLDGHLTFFNLKFCSAVEDLLVDSPVTRDRFFLFTSNRYSYFLPQMHRCFALSEASPHVIDALDGGVSWSEQDQRQHGLIRVMYKEQWVARDNLVSGSNFQLVSRGDNQLHLRLTGSLDGMLEELAALGIVVLQLVWEH